VFNISSLYLTEQDFN